MRSGLFSIGISCEKNGVGKIAEYDVWAEDSEQ